MIRFFAISIFSSSSILLGLDTIFLGLVVCAGFYRFGADTVFLGLGDDTGVDLLNQSSYYSLDVLITFYVSFLSDHFTSSIDRYDRKKFL